MSKRFYAVQHGDDYSSDFGSTVKREAYRMAKLTHEDFPGEEVRICFCTVDDDTCEREEVVYSASVKEEKTYFLDRGEIVISYHNDEKRPSTARELYRAFYEEQGETEQLNEFTVKEEALKELHSRPTEFTVRQSVLPDCIDYVITVYIISEQTVYDDDYPETTAEYVCDGGSIVRVM